MNPYVRVSVGWLVDLLIGRSGSFGWLVGLSSLSKRAGNYTSMLLQELSKPEIRFVLVLQKWQVTGHEVVDRPNGGIVAHAPTGSDSRTPRNIAIFRLIPDSYAKHIQLQLSSLDEFSVIMMTPKQNGLNTIAFFFACKDLQRSADPADSLADLSQLLMLSASSVSFCRVSFLLASKSNCNLHKLFT